MPIRRIKALSPDPYLGKIKGDTELARLAHLNYVIDEINKGNGGGSGGGSIEINGNTPVTSLTIGPVASETYNNGSLDITIDPYPGYKVYRAKIATQTIDWPGYGYLYNWFALFGPTSAGIANPDGGTGLSSNQWRVPSDTDWDTLVTFAGGPSVAGGKLKSTLNSTAYPFYGWLSNGGGTDDYNFGGLSGGLRDFNGPFNAIGNFGLWWSSTAFDSTNAWSRYLFYNSSFVYRQSDNKSFGFSVRLVREATASELLLNDGDTSNTSSLDPYTGNDGKTYVTVKIGTQIWLAQNLRETKYNDNSDIFDCSILSGSASNSLWQAKGAAQEGTWTAYLFGSGNLVPYDPATVTLFYNDVLENTLGTTDPFPFWYSSSDVNGPDYRLNINRPWNKTHIKITPGYDVSDFPTINERSLLIQSAADGGLSITFRPIKRDNTGAITIERLNNYPRSTVSYVYVEILEYPAAYYGSGLSVAVGASNLEEEEEVVALTYEINGVTYTEDLEAKKLSIEIAKIYERLGITF